MARARITSKGQITIPKEIRDRLGVETGDMLEFLPQGTRLEVRAHRRRQMQEFRGVFRIARAKSFDEERANAWVAQTRRLTGGARRRRG